VGGVGKLLCSVWMSVASCFAVCKGMFCSLWVGLTKSQVLGCMGKAGYKIMTITCLYRLCEEDQAALPCGADQDTH